jgi:tRNA-2-methylthio-N6-dimethylallyladenosine synthase
LRFTSPHPIGFREDLVEAYRRLPKLVDHLHLPVQSGSNKILKAMHRTYTAEKYLDLVRRVRDARPGISITTDVIVGFPGESKDDFRQTRTLLEDVQFDNAFIFRYSPRSDTPAAQMRDQIEEPVKERRNQELLEVVNQSALRINQRMVGQKVEVLCEGPSKTNATRLAGRTRTNKIVHFEGGKELIGALIDVRIERTTAFSLYGKPASIDAMAV